MRVLFAAFLFAHALLACTAADDAGLKITAPTMVLIGPSGVGKTTVLNGALEYFPDTFTFPVSTTTRDRRPEETNGVAYNFVSEETFAQMADDGQFLVVSPHNGKKYGLTIDAVKKAAATGKIVVPQHMSAKDALRLKEKDIFTNAKYVIIVPPGQDLDAEVNVLRQRLTGRGTETEAATAERLRDATNECSYATKKGLWDLVLVNDDLHTAVVEYVTFIRETFDVTPKGALMFLAQASSMHSGTSFHPQNNLMPGYWGAAAGVAFMSILFAWQQVLRPSYRDTAGYSLLNSPILTA